jgi:hypothetical protein
VATEELLPRRARPGGGLSYEMSLVCTGHSFIRR